MRHTRHCYEKGEPQVEEANGAMRIVVAVSKLAIMAGVATVAYVTLAPLLLM